MPIRLLLVLLVTLGGCGSSGPPHQRLSLTGSSTVAPLAAEIARRFEAGKPGARVHVETGGSTRGINDALAGRSDLGLVSRALGPEESADLVAFTVAIDGIACIVHADNPVRDLSSRQIVDIFRGTVTSWAEVGGPELEIVVVNKAEGRSTLELFCAHFGLAPEEIRAHAVIGDNAQGIRTVAANRGAIAYVSIGSALTDMQAGLAIRPLDLDGRSADLSAVRDGTWPLARPLNLIARRDRELAPLVQAYVSLALSPEVDDLILDLALVPPAR